MVQASLSFDDPSIAQEKSNNMAFSYFPIEPPFQFSLRIIQAFDFVNRFLYICSTFLQKTSPAKRPEMGKDILQQSSGLTGDARVYPAAHPPAKAGGVNVYLATHPRPKAGGVKKLCYFR
jgi:hypothetical protein